jgi:hypothetical protein
MKNINRFIEKNIKIDPLHVFFKLNYVTGIT